MSTSHASSSSGGGDVTSEQQAQINDDAANALQVRFAAMQALIAHRQLGVAVDINPRTKVRYGVVEEQRARGVAKLQARDAQARRDAEAARLARMQALGMVVHRDDEDEDGAGGSSLRRGGGGGGGAAPTKTARFAPGAAGGKGGGKGAGAGGGFKHPHPSEGDSEAEADGHGGAPAHAHPAPPHGAPAHPYHAPHSHHHVEVSAAPVGPKGLIARSTALAESDARDSNVAAGDHTAFQIHKRGSGSEAPQAGTGTSGGAAPGPGGRMPPPLLRGSSDFDFNASAELADEGRIQFVKHEKKSLFALAQASPTVQASSRNLLKKASSSSSLLRDEVAAAAAAGDHKAIKQLFIPGGAEVEEQRKKRGRILEGKLRHLQEVDLATLLVDVVRFDPLRSSVAMLEAEANELAAASTGLAGGAAGASSSSSSSSGADGAGGDGGGEEGSGAGAAAAGSKLGQNPSFPEFAEHLPKLMRWVACRIAVSYDPRKFAYYFLSPVSMDIVTDCFWLVHTRLFAEKARQRAARKEHKRMLAQMIGQGGAAGKGAAAAASAAEEEDEEEEEATLSVTAALLPSEETLSATEVLVESLALQNYMLLKAVRSNKYLFAQFYPYAVADAVFNAFVYLLPGSKAQYTTLFRLSVFTEITRLLSGVELAPTTVARMADSLFPDEVPSNKVKGLGGGAGGGAGGPDRGGGGGGSRGHHHRHGGGGGGGVKSSPPASRGSMRSGSSPGGASGDETSDAESVKEQTRRTDRRAQTWAKALGFRSAFELFKSTAPSDRAYLGLDAAARIEIIRKLDRTTIIPTSAFLITGASVPPSTVISSGSINELITPPPASHARMYGHGLGPFAQTLSYPEKARRQARDALEREEQLKQQRQALPSGSPLRSPSLAHLHAGASHLTPPGGRLGPIPSVSGGASWGGGGGGGGGASQYDPNASVAVSEAPRFAEGGAGGSFASQELLLQHQHQQQQSLPRKLQRAPVLAASQLQGFLMHPVAWLATAGLVAGVAVDPTKVDSAHPASYDTSSDPNHRALILGKTAAPASSVTSGATAAARSTGAMSIGGGSSVASSVLPGSRKGSLAVPGTAHTGQHSSSPPRTAGSSTSPTGRGGGENKRIIQNAVALAHARVQIRDEVHRAEATATVTGASAAAAASKAGWAAAQAVATHRPGLLPGVVTPAVSPVASRGHGQSSPGDFGDGVREDGGGGRGQSAFAPLFSPIASLHGGDDAAVAGGGGSQVLADSFSGLDFGGASSGGSSGGGYGGGTSAAYFAPEDADGAAVDEEGNIIVGLGADGLASIAGVTNMPAVGAELAYKMLLARSKGRPLRVPFITTATSTLLQRALPHVKSFRTGGPRAMHKTVPVHWSRTGGVDTFRSFHGHLAEDADGPGATSSGARGPKGVDPEDPSVSPAILAAAQIAAAEAAAAKARTSHAAIKSAMRAVTQTASRARKEAVESTRAERDELLASGRGRIARAAAEVRHARARKQQLKLADIEKSAHTRSLRGPGEDGTGEGAGAESATGGGGGAKAGGTSSSSTSSSSGPVVDRSDPGMYGAMIVPVEVPTPGAGGSGGGASEGGAGGLGAGGPPGAAAAAAVAHYTVRTALQLNLVQLANFARASGSLTNGPDPTVFAVPRRGPGADGIDEGAGEILLGNQGLSLGRVSRFGRGGLAATGHGVAVEVPKSAVSGGVVRLLAQLGGATEGSSLSTTGAKAAAAAAGKAKGDVEGAEGAAASDGKTQEAE
jgi:hypothetical protein